MKNAVFLDRDGTLIEDVGHLRSPIDINFYADVYAALKILKKDFLLFIITNQTGISKGHLTVEEVNEVNKAIIKRFSEESINITDIYVCPHSKEGKCICSKPESYFLLEAAKKYNIDLASSYLIGDHPEDVYCAENAGATGIYLLIGHGVKHLHEFAQKPIIKADILAAAKYINSK